jgi:hypothetical protein
MRKHSLNNNTRQKPRASRMLNEKKKIIVISDSHAWGCTVEIPNTVGKSYEVTSTVMPGARNETITSMAENEISNLSKEDILIVMSGANDAK